MAATTPGAAVTPRRRPRWAAYWGLGLGIAEIAAWALIIIMLIAAADAVSHSGYTYGG